MGPTVFRAGGLRFYFFSREEPRLHVHVQGTSGEAKFWLAPEIALFENYGLSARGCRARCASSGSMRMKSARHGRRISAVEVSNISPNGIWLLLDERELFLPFEQFPWFRKAPIDALLDVRRPQEHHLWWPALDVDLAVESIEHPARYPLVSRVAPTVVCERVAPRRRVRAPEATPKTSAKPRRA